MPHWRRRRVRVGCTGSRARLSVGDLCTWRPGMYLCPKCKQLIHKRADGTAPTHWREEVG